MKKKLLLPFIFILLVLLTPAAKADEALEDELLQRSGAVEIYDSLNGEAKELLSQMGIETITDTADESNLFSVLSQLVCNRLSQPIKALALLVAVIVLCKLAYSFDSQEIDWVISLAGALACAVAVISPLLSLIQTASGIIESASAFLLASVPVYSALMLAEGSAAAGTSYGFLALVAGNSIPIISTVLIIPLLHVFLALALLSSVSQAKLDRLAEAIYSFTKWILVLSVTIFSAVLSVQTVLNAQVDAVGNKAVKLIASSAIPIVGSAFGDAVATIQNSVSVVKSGVGAFGMLAALCIFIPTATEAFLWTAVCVLGQITAELFELSKLGSFLKMCASAARMILAVIAAVCAVSLVCAAIVLFVKAHA